jgi:ABC-2 type transport system permease protein
MSSLSESSLYQLTVVRLRLFLRDRGAIFWIMVFPVLLSLGLGIAFRNMAADVLPVAATTPQLQQALNAQKSLSATRLDETSGARALTVGSILLLAVQTPDGVIYRYDGTNADARRARLLADDAIQVLGGRRDPIHSADELIHEHGSRYIDFVIPGVLGMNLLGSALWWLTSSIVDARQKKLLKLLLGSPMPRWQYLAAFPFSGLLILVVQVAIFIGCAKLAFDVPLRGSLWQLGLLCVLASFSFTALGLLISSRARSIEAANGWINLTALPMWILSGVFFSTSHFPAAVQPVIHALPLTAAIDTFRSNMLLGTDISQLGAPIVTLLAWLVVPFFVALKVFRWR